MKRALILSGGGAKGAFSIGVLEYIYENRPDLTFDIISGTSTGALIASMIILDDISFLLDIYQSVSNDDVLRYNDVLGNVRDKKPYLVSDAPLEKMIHDKITTDLAPDIINSEKTLCLTAVSLQTGKITVFCNKDIPSTDKYDVRQIKTRSDLILALRASGNQAGFLPPISMPHIPDEQFIDGGIREVIPTSVVIDLNPDEVLVLSNNPEEISQIDDKYTGFMGVMMRAIQIFIQDVRRNDIDALKRWREDTGKKVYFIEPAKDLDFDYPTGLRFSPVLMGQNVEIGYRAAKPVIDNIPIAPGVLADADNHICKATTLANVRCKNQALANSQYCHVHQT